MIPGRAASVACRPQRGALPAAHELVPARELPVCCMGAPRVLSKLVGTLPPSFFPVVTLPPLTSTSVLLGLLMPCSWGNCWVPNPTTPTGHAVTGFPDTMLQMFPLHLVKPAAITTTGSRGMQTSEQEHPNSISYASKILTDAGDSSPTSCVHQTGEPTHVLFIPIAGKKKLLQCVCSSQAKPICQKHLLWDISLELQMRLSLSYLWFVLY